MLQLVVAMQQHCEQNCIPVFSKQIDACMRLVVLAVLLSQGYTTGEEMPDRQWVPRLRVERNIHDTLSACRAYSTPELHTLVCIGTMNCRIQRVAAHYPGLLKSTRDAPSISE